MPMAHIAARAPKQVHLEPGNYHWCACGRSRNQPFCDGSHRGTGIVPVAFTITEAADKWLCMCKQTKGAPFCDGSHKRLPEGVTEMESTHLG